MCSISTRTLILVIRNQEVTAQRKKAERPSKWGSRAQVHCNLFHFCYYLWGPLGSLFPPWTVFPITKQTQTIHLMFNQKLLVLPSKEYHGAWYIDSENWLTKYLLNIYSIPETTQDIRDTVFSNRSSDGALAWWNTQFTRSLFLLLTLWEFPESRVVSASLDPKKRQQPQYWPLSGPGCTDRDLCLGLHHQITLPTHSTKEMQGLFLTWKDGQWEKHFCLFVCLKSLKRNSSWNRGLAADQRDGTASRSGCFQGANLSISSQLVGGRERNPCPIVAAAVTTAACSLLSGVGVCPKGAASLHSLSCQLFNWPGCISAAEPGPSLSLSSPGFLLASLGKKWKLFLVTYSLGSAPAVSSRNFGIGPFVSQLCRTPYWSRETPWYPGLCWATE